MSDEFVQFDDFDALESSLAAFLAPVRPSHAYIEKIRTRISRRPIVEMTQPEKERQRALTAIGGVLGVSLLLLTVARALFYFFGSRRA